MRRRALNPLIWAAVVLAAIIAGRWEQKRAAPDRPAATRSEQQIPDAAERAQVVATLALIEKGGPFPHPKSDGTVFANREGRLPPHPRGYYREYTVPTPGAGSRGARRIVRGTGGETWYTRDHYATFVRLDQPARPAAPVAPP